MIALCAPFLTRHSSLASVSAFTFAADSVVVLARVMRVVLSESSQRPTLNSRSSMTVLCAPLRTSNCSLSAVSACTFAADSVVVLARVVRVVFRDFSQRSTLDSRSSMTVLCAPFLTRHASRAAESSPTFAAASAVVSASVARVVLRDFSQRPTLDSRSSMTVLCAPFLTRHSSLAAARSFTFAADSAVVSASVARVVLRDFSQRPTLDSRSSMTVLCAPFLTRHSSLAAVSSLSWTTIAAICSSDSSSDSSICFSIT